MDQRLQKRREASKLRSARHRARQKREWEDLRKETQELRQRVVLSEQKLEMVLGYLLNNDLELWCKIHSIVAGTSSLETLSPTQDNEMLELWHMSKLFRKTHPFPDLQKRFASCFQTRERFF